MATIAERIELGPNEFAFHFETMTGLDADALANFLKRAATVARQQGGQLRVVGLRRGSVAVVVKAIRKGAAKEFTDKPIDTTIKASAFVAGIVGAIVLAMSPAKSGDTPVARAGADIVENHKVTQITVVFNESSTVVMNPTIAAEVREAERSHTPLLAKPEQPERLTHRVVEMLEDARQGNLAGDTALLGDVLHFRPDGYRYWVPIEVSSVAGRGQLFAGGHFRVRGRIATRAGQPDRIVMEWAERTD